MVNFSDKSVADLHYFNREFMGKIPRIRERMYVCGAENTEVKSISRANVNPFEGLLKC